MKLTSPCQSPFGRVFLRIINVEYICLLQNLLSWNFSASLSLSLKDWKGEILVRIPRRIWDVIVPVGVWCAQVNKYRHCQEKTHVLWNLKIMQPRGTFLYYIILFILYYLLYYFGKCHKLRLCKHIFKALVRNLKKKNRKFGLFNFMINQFVE